MFALFIIDGCPAQDRRAKEALRIAAGISPWGKVKPAVCFSHGLGQSNDPETHRYFTLLRETSGGLFTMAGDENEWLQPINEDGLSKLENDADAVLRFGSAS